MATLMAAAGSFAPAWGTPSNWPYCFLDVLVQFRQSALSPSAWCDSNVAAQAHAEAQEMQRAIR
jgi:hypothetical protein